MLAYQTFTSSPSPHIYAELLLVSRINYTLKILFCLLVMVVDIDNAACTETRLFCKEH
jgi:hypothetical protein